MKVQEKDITPILREKILLGVEPPSLDFTRRDLVLPKVKNKAIAVIGMRRAGKTTFLHQCRADLIKAGRSPDQLLYFNFEDERLDHLHAEQLHLIPEMQQRLFSEKKGEALTLFLDEIQRVSGWEVFVRRLLDTPGYEVFVSGSSAKLLSREVATSLRGRAWEMIIDPFSFREFLKSHGLDLPAEKKLTFKNKSILDRHFASFLDLGGLPEAQSLDLVQRRQLLQGYVDVLLLRDVIERHNVSNVIALRWMVRRLMGNAAGLFSITKFSSDLKSQGIAVSRDTLYDFLDHLEDTFLLSSISIGTDSEKRRQVNPKKIYPADTGFIPLFDRSGKKNSGHLLETAVFIELKRRRVEIAYISNHDGTEVDFLARYPSGSESLIQVCASVDDPETLRREVRALQEARKKHPRAHCLILTLEARLPFPAHPKFVTMMPAWEWMLYNFVA